MIAKLIANDVCKVYGIEYAEVIRHGMKCTMLLSKVKLINKLIDSGVEDVDGLMHMIDEYCADDRSESELEYRSESELE